MRIDINEAELSEVVDRVVEKIVREKYTEKIAAEIMAQRKWLSAEEAAAAFGLSERWVRDLANRQKLVTKTDGFGERVTKYLRKDFEDLIEQGKIKSTTLIAREERERKAALRSLPTERRAA